MVEYIAHHSGNVCSMLATPACSAYHACYGKPMSDVSIRELRNRGGDIVDRVTAGERVVITRSGTPVAELRPLSRRIATTAALVQRRRSLPPVDPAALRADIDEVIDPTL
jgi:prevent-host-death family protein